MLSMTRHPPAVQATQKVLDKAERLFGATERPSPQSAAIGLVSLHDDRVDVIYPDPDDGESKALAVQWSCGCARVLLLLGSRAAQLTSPPAPPARPLCARSSRDRARAAGFGMQALHSRVLRPFAGSSMTRPTGCPLAFHPPERRRCLRQPRGRTVP